MILLNDTTFLSGEQVDRLDFKEENVLVERLIFAGTRFVTGKICKTVILRDAEAMEEAREAEESASSETTAEETLTAE